jgi:hypothetical protein
MSIIQPLKELYMKIFGVTDSAGGFGEILIEVGAMAGDIFQTLGSIIGSVINILSFVLTPVIHGLVGVFKFLYGLVKIAAFGLAKLGDTLQDVGMFFDRLFDQILAALGKMTKGLFGISQEEYDQREKNRQSLQEDRDKTRKIRDDERSRTQEKVQQSKNELKQDTKKFKEQKLTHEKLTGAAKREAEAKEAAVKAQEKLLDYSAGPEELLKQFSGKQGGAVEIGIKKQEIGKEKDAADKELAAAKTGAEKKAAAEKIEAAEKKLEALNKAEELAKSRTTTASPDLTKTVGALASTQPTAASTDKPAVPASAKPQPTTQTDASKKALEADAEKKKQEEEAKAKADAEAKAKEDAAAKEKQEQDKKAQESPSVLLAELNTKMAQMIKLQAQTTTNTYENVMATKGLNKNLYKA